MLRRLYDWTMDLAAKRGAMRALFTVSFIESSVFPIPPDILLVPMVLANREKAWRIAGVCTIGSVLGGIAGYYIGLALYDVFLPVLELVHITEAKMEAFSKKFNEWGFWWVAMAGVTPFPYKVITIASGLNRLDFLTFVLASVSSRGMRFYLEAFLLWRYGEKMREFIEKYLGWVVTIGFIAVFLIFVAIKYLL